MERDLALSCAAFDCDRLLVDWRWLVPEEMRPLMIGIFGDWVFAAPDASHWHLDLLEGAFLKIADNSQAFNAMKAQPAYRDAWFGADWAHLALQNGLVPGPDACLGWKVAPVLGGEFALENIRVFPLLTYQVAMGGLFRHLHIS
ncbi:MAG: T6SS immunity protein Tdi1 domain-containing protein [Pseudomonadota bacterium]